MSKDVEKWKKYFLQKNENSFSNFCFNFNFQSHLLLTLLRRQPEVCLTPDPIPKDWSSWPEGRFPFPAIWSSRASIFWASLYISVFFCCKDILIYPLQKMEKKMRNDDNERQDKWWGWRANIFDDEEWETLNAWVKQKTCCIKNSELWIYGYGTRMIVCVCKWWRDGDNRKVVVHVLYMYMKVHVSKLCSHKLQTCVHMFVCLSTLSYHIPYIYDVYYKYWFYLLFQNIFSFHSHDQKNEEK